MAPAQWEGTLVNASFQQTCQNRSPRPKTSQKSSCKSKCFGMRGAKWQLKTLRKVLCVLTSKDRPSNLNVAPQENICHCKGTINGLLNTLDFISALSIQSFQCPPESRTGSLRTLWGAAVAILFCIFLKVIYRPKSKSQGTDQPMVVTWGEARPVLATADGPSISRVGNFNCQG